MATADIPRSERERWLPDNPWTWQVVGLGSTALALLWSRLFSPDADLGRLTLLILGLLCLGVGLIQRLNSPGGSFIDELLPRRRRQLLVCIQLAGAVLGASILLLFLASTLNLDIPWTAGQVWFVTIVTLPGALYLFLFPRWHLCQRGTTINKAQEASLLLLFTAVTLFLASWALYGDQHQALAWDTIRTALALFALAAYLGSWLAALPQGWRRFALSLLVIIHFTAIMHAVLAAPPAVPWLINQGWIRFYRPYLEFMHLNNAYQFYAPEPSPSTQVWFYVEYERGQGEQKETLHHWLKIPDIKPDGTPNYSLALSYQRRIAMSELVARWENPYALNHPIYFYRQVNSPTPPQATVGKPLPAAKLEVPLHPELALANQFEHTSGYFREVIAGYARSVVRRPHPNPDYADAKGVSVKVYRVRHMILSQSLAAQGIHPQEPYMFLPFYQGQFDRDGKMMDFPIFNDQNLLVSGDPFLYWLLPFEYLPKDSTLPLSERTVRGWAFKHAGDPNWIRRPHREYWEPE